MTSTATCTVHAVDTYASPSSFSFSSPASLSLSARQSLKSAASREQSAGHVRPGSGSKRALKRSIHSRDSFGMASELERAGEDTSDASAWGSSVTQSTWLKRLSTFSSLDSSLPSSPRPGSAAVSQSNGSVAFSNSGSTTPMFATYPPPPPSLPPNKLVKRSSSIHSTKSTSRLPIPSLRRPATSHQRDAASQIRPAISRHHSTTASFDLASSPLQQEQWTAFFTPKVAAETPSSTWRRNSTGIPNPIKRIYPDRKYRPVLLSARDAVAPASLEFDDQELDTHDELLLKRTPTAAKLTRRFFSSPLPAKAPLQLMPLKEGQSLTEYKKPSLRRSSTSLQQPQTTKQEIRTAETSPTNLGTELHASRSFSPSDLVPVELPKWKRPSSNRITDTKYRRRGGRSASGPQPSMGNRQSIKAGDTERPAKRRDVSGVSTGYDASTAGRGHMVKEASSPLHEVHLDLFSSKTSPSTFTYSPQVISSPKHRIPEDHRPLSEARVSPSPNSMSSGSRPSGASESASTAAESDDDTYHRNGDAPDGRGDNIYDSVRTRATSTSSGVKSLAIESIFDESRRIKVDSTSAEQLQPLQKIPHLRQDLLSSARHSIIEEEDSVSTPVRPAYTGVIKPSPVFRFGESPQSQEIASSPPEMPIIFGRSNGRLADPLDDDDDGTWSLGSHEEGGDSRLPVCSRFPHLDTRPDRLSPYTNSHGSSSLTTTPQRVGQANGADLDTRSSIFDWSEQQPMDKSPGNRSPPRPKTVHGKKDAESRGSRSVGRRAPSGIHARSQSVPVAQEADGKRSQVVTNKFGTWGVGSKGVTEDWNEDFEFEEPVPPLPSREIVEEKRFDSGMFVPKSIREQQQNVLANIGLLRDWGLLIEELKELRIRAVGLKLMSGKHMDMWNEVDAMVDLADQESQDHTLAPRNSPPSSPTFDYDAFDEPLPVVSPRHPTYPPGLAKDDDVFQAYVPSPTRKDLEAKPSTPRRPRKDSEAVAKSVIEALQQKRNVSDPTLGGAVAQASKKVPFDTATLKRIVPYVQDLRDKVKKALRETEGLYTSPLNRHAPEEDPTFSRIFREPPDSPSGRRITRRSTAATDHVLSDDAASRSPDDLTARLKLMTVI